MEEKVRRIGKKREKAIVKPETKIQHHGPKRGGGIPNLCACVKFEKDSMK